MPVRKYTTKKRKVTRRPPRYRIKYGTLGRPYARPLLNAGFPKKMIMKHKYVDQKTLTCTSGVLATYQYYCNGMYDPQVATGGHQPMYFDQMTPIYNHWAVIGSKIKVSIFPQNNDPATVDAGRYPYKAGIFINDDTTVTPSDFNSMLEQSQAKGSAWNVYQAGTKNSAMTNKWSLKKFFPGAKLSNEVFRGTVSANPTENSVFTIFVEPLENATTCSYQLLVELEYIAVWWERKDIGGS